MFARLGEMPWQCQSAWQKALDFDLPADYRKVNKVVILGMGASAIGGELLSSLVVPEAKLPIIVHGNYNLPAFVDAQTLVIASSYSGNTEEVLSAFEQALGSKAKTLAMTTGGELKKVAGARNIPLFTYDYKTQPRAALGFGFLPLLCFFQRLGFIADKSAEVTEMVGVLQQLITKIGPSASLSGNPAKQLARRLYGRLVVVYGANFLSEVAHRWKTQMNENSKAWSFYEVLPELNHNAIVGYRFPPELAGKIMVVLLHSGLLPPRVQLRYQLTAGLLDQFKLEHQLVAGDGNSPLSQMMSLILFGDFVSDYLALLYQIDPSPVAVIDYLKEQLRLK